MSEDDEDFYRRNAGALIRLTTALVGPTDAEDLVATAVLNVMRSKTWPGLSEDEKRAYLYRSVVNEARAIARRVGRRKHSEELYQDFRTRSSAVPERLDVISLVANLSVRQRAVVFLTYWEDLDTRSVAERLGISEGSVYQHLNRARTALRSRIDA